MGSPPLIMTIGHSTRPLDAFTGLLAAHGVTGVVDVRKYPASRRYPHFAQAALTASLASQGVEYRHYAALGGRRPPGADSTNAGWQHPAFRAYADYMWTDAFAGALDELLGFAQTGRIAIMCAEATWWRCHRRLIADALVVRGVEVRHIMATDRAPAHELTPFARVSGVQIQYPGLF